MGDQAALSGGLRLIDVRQILDVFLEQTHSHLHELSDNLGAQGDAERKRALLLFLHNTKQRLLRLLVVVKWANKARVVAEVGRILDVAARQAHACRDAADQLAYLHGELEDTRLPAYDVSTALEVLQTGDYALLPSCIEELRPPPAPRPDVRRARLRLMDHILRCALLQEKLPAGVSVASVGGGVTELRCGDVWEARLTLVPAPPKPPDLPAAQQDAPAEVGPGAEPVSSDDKPHGPSGVEPAPKGAGLSEPVSAKAEPMDVDMRHNESRPSEPLSQGVTGEASEEPSEAGGVLDERWRWRVLSAKALPHFTSTALMAHQQASQLQGAIEMRMWAASEAAEEDERRGVHQQIELVVKPEPGSSEQGPSDSGVPEVKPKMNVEAQAADSRSEADQGEPQSRQPPLAILHGILRDVASRLVLNQAVLWARSATKGPDGRWVRLLRIEPAKTLSLGIRICYWLNVPAVTPADLQRLQQPEQAPPPPRSTQQQHHHTPPAIEIGVAKSGEPTVVACPELVHAVHSANVPAPEGTVALSLDLVSLDAEQVLLQAAQANAAIQLAAIEALLHRSGNLQANNGTIALQAPPAGGVASGALPSPILELTCDRQPLLHVTVQLRTGRLLLRAGDGGGSGAGFSGLGQEMAPLLRQEEERLAAVQAEALKQTPPEALGTAGAAAADRLARTLESLWLNLSVRSRYSQLLSAAQDLGLYRAQIPPALLKAYAAANPLARLPAKNVLILAFPPAPPMSAPAGPQAGSVHASRQERLDSLLGKGAAGVQLYLQAEMCRGLQWRYGLVVASCDARNMPVKVLQIIPVPLDLDSRQASSASDGQPSTSTSTQQSSNKQKQEQVVRSTSEAPGSGQRPEQAAAGGDEEMVRGVRAEGTPGTEAQPDQAQWGLAHAAELGEVVRWCTPRITLELLRLQLKVLGVSYTEEVCLAQLSTAACAHMANGAATAPAALKDKTAAAIAASGALQRQLRLHGLHSLRLLDHVNGLSGTTGVLLHMNADPKLGRCSWRVAVQSAYFGGLPSSCAGCPNKADTRSDTQHISQTPQGLILHYSFATGGTVERAVTDLRRLIRLHLALARMTALMRAAKGNVSNTSLEADNGPAASSAAAQTVMGQALQHAASALANGNTAKNHAGPVENGGAGHKEIAGPQLGSAPLMWQAQEGSGVVSVSAVGPDRAILTVAPPTDADADATRQTHAGSAGIAATGILHSVLRTIQGLSEKQSMQLQLSMEWGAVRHSSAAQSGSMLGMDGGSGTVQGSVPSGIRCRMSSTPDLPTSLLEAFADMADAGEEELLLDALSVCGCTLATLAAELAPHALLDAGLLPEEVSLRAVVAPYKLRLSIVQGRDAELAVGMHLLAGGLIWLAPSATHDRVRTEVLHRLSRLSEAFLPDAPSNAEPEQEASHLSAEESKGRGPQTAPSVLDSAMEIDGVSSPPLEAPAGSGAVAAKAGLWVRITALPAAVRTVLQIAAEML